MQKYKNELGKLMVVMLLLPVIYFSTPQKADAQWVVTDPAHTALTAGNLISLVATHLKEFVLDTLATNIAKTVLKQLTAQTVNWINAGFKGNPAYVTNTGQFFLNTGDTVAAQFLSSNGALNSLCSPFQAKIRLALAKNYLQETNANNFSCTLGKLENNFDAFTKDFNQGGWEGWFQMTQISQNNPYGAYQDTKDQLDINIGTTQNKYQAQLTQGKGFLSWQTCKPGTNLSEKFTGVCSLGDQTSDIGTQSACEAQGGTWTPNVDQTDSTDCADSDKVVNTPGSVIADKLSGVINNDVVQLELVQSINQVVGALITQLTQQIVGGIGNGLRGLSQSTPSNNNRALITQLASSPTMVDPTTGKTVPNPSTENGQEYQQVVSGINANAQTAPSMTLLGEAQMTVTANSAFADPGVVATDLTDGNITSQVVTSPATIDTSTPGTYTITYTVTNSAGISATPLSRTVNVVAATTSTTGTTP